MAIPPGNGPYTDFAGVEMDMRVVAENHEEFESRLQALEAAQLRAAWLSFQTTGAGPTDFEVVASNGLRLTTISGSDATLTWVLPRANADYIPFGTVNSQTDAGPSGTSWGPRAITLTSFVMRFGDTAGNPSAITGFFPRVFFVAVLAL